MNIYFLSIFIMALIYNVNKRDADISASTNFDNAFVIQTSEPEET